MKKALVALIAGLLLAPSAAFAQYHSDPTTNQLIILLMEQVKVLQAQLESLLDREADERREQREPQNNLSRDGGRIQLLNIASGNVFDEFILLELKVTPATGSVNKGDIKVEVDFYPKEGAPLVGGVRIAGKDYGPSHAVGIRLLGPDVINKGKTETIRVRVTNPRLGVSLQYAIKEISFRTTDGERHRYQGDPIVGEVMVF